MGNALPPNYYSADVLFHGIRIFRTVQNEEERASSYISDDDAEKDDGERERKSPAVFQKLMKNGQDQTMKHY